jgi:hypothetical protein
VTQEELVAVIDNGIPNDEIREMHNQQLAVNNQILETLKQINFKLEMLSMRSTTTEVMTFG